MGASISASDPILSARQWIVTPVTAVLCGYRFQGAVLPSLWERETMHRARVKAVSGNRVLADGSWLTCIGNHAVYPGEWIWTDGRCVYGHESEGGSSYVPTNVLSGLSGIPILRREWKDNKALTRYVYYAKGKLRNLGFGKDEEWMVNRGGHFSFFDTAYLDAEMDEQGNLYTLEAVAVYVYPLIGADQRDSILSVKRNGEIIASYDLVPMFGAPVVSGPTDLYSCQTEGGRVDKAGNFKVMIWHGTFRDMADGRRIKTDRYVVFDGRNIEPWLEEIETSSSDDTTGEVHTSKSRWIASDGSIRFPIYDGMYMLLPSDRDFCLSSSRCSTPIYGAQDELIMKIDTHAGGRVNICPLDQGKYLVSMVPSSVLGTETSNLYLWEGGKLTYLMDECLNRRLRRMNHLGKWKKVGGV